MGPALFTLLLTALVSSAVTESLDITTIYRYHLPAITQGTGATVPLNASEEFHMRTNALGILVRASNGTYQDPVMSSLQLQCINGTSGCSWSQTGTWSITNQDMDDVLPRLRIKYGGNACDVKNGGCQATCQMSNGSPVCSCPSGFTLNSDRTTCRSSNSNYNLMVGNSGRINSPNFPSYYHNGAFVAWLFIAPEGNRVKLTFTNFDTEPRYDYVNVFDGVDGSAQRLGQFSGNSIPSVLYSKHNKMYITFSSDGSNVRSGFAANLAIEKQNEPTFTLTSSVGTLRSTSMISTQSKVCVSVIYKLASSKHDINVLANPSRKPSVNLKRVALSQVNNWNIGRFTGELDSHDITRSLSVTVSLNEAGSSIFSIMGCNPLDDEDVYIAQNSMPLDNIPKPETSRQIYTVSRQKCYNGGIEIPDTNDCRCPDGFRGPACEEGCGPNSYGQDCAGICSGFKRGCRLMVFCKYGLPCMCAPGFAGKKCDSECSSGYYGASCRRPCGNCNGGSCDIYTGECVNGCRPGFYPPLCQDTYRILSTTPTLDSKHTTSGTINANLTSTIGHGVSKFYQVQYKEIDTATWQQLQPLEVTSEVMQANITGLKSGVKYLARVILIDRDGNSYQEDDVPTVELRTPCIAPNLNEYTLTSKYITSSSFTVSWKYDMKLPTWCPLSNYEVTLHDRWEQFTHKQSAAEMNVSFTNLLPGYKYGVQVQAVTPYVKAPISEILYITTGEQAPGQVIELGIQPGGIGELRVSWKKPRFLGGTIRRYRVEYQCLKQLACSHSCETSSGLLEVSTEFIVLTGLLPHAQYMVKVAGLSGELGHYKAVITSTEHAAASIAPASSPVPVIQRTNTSFVAKWQEPDNCTGLNGFLQGYRYELVTNSEHGDHIERSGSTTDTHANFTDLSPHTQYKVFVYLVTSGGWSTRYKLVIHGTTSATIPEHVQDLTVYKRGRRMLGVRWAPPLLSYGTLKSFSVSHHIEGQDASTGVRESIEQTWCSAWPGLYCHTINHLVPDTRYVVTVQARNEEIEKDGSPVSVTDITREIAPAAPKQLQILNRTQNTLVMEWGTPDVINGILRSFLVNVEETDSFNVTDCCSYYPIQELIVRNEEQFYRLEVGGLNPASTYTISVSAKTVNMGPTINATTCTPPNPPEVVHPPELLSRASENDLYSVGLRTVKIPSGLKGTYLLLIISPDVTTETLIWDPEVAEHLQTLVNESFYIAAEYQQDDLASDDEEANLGTGSALTNGTIGQYVDPVLLPGTYRVGLAVVLDYSGAKSVGFAACKPFTVS